MKNRVGNYAFYVLTAVICLVMYYWFKAINDETLKILLYPHAKLTELYYNLPFQYVDGLGYSSISNSFAIGPQCLGGNFIIMLFGMSVCTFAEHFKGMGRFKWLAVSLTGSFVIGILVSSIRIIGSVPFVSSPRFAVYHSTIGISLYFFALLAAYAVLKKMFRGDRSEETI